MFIESSALYSIFGLLFVGLSLRRKSAAHLFLPFLGNLEVSPRMQSKMWIRAEFSLGDMPTSHHISSHEWKGLDTRYIRANSELSEHAHHPVCSSFTS